MKEITNGHETPENGKNGEPWKLFEGRCQTVKVYHWQSHNRDIYQVAGSGQVFKTTSNRASALRLAKTLSDVPAKLAPTLAAVDPELLNKALEAYQKLEPVLTPLEMSIHAGLEEYAALKTRTGKLALAELFDSLLTGGSSPVNTAMFAERLRDISIAIAKLAPLLEPLKISIPSAIEEYAAVKAQAGAQDLRELFGQLLSKVWVQRSKTPIADVLESFLAAKRNEAGVSYEYFRRLYYMLGYLVERLPKKIAIGAVTTDMLKEIVFRPGIGPWSKRTDRGNVLTFFHWCQLNQYLDYSTPTAADALERIRLPKPSPRILTVPEAAAILTALDDPWCLLYLALSLFTAIRHDELQEFTFAMIKPGKIIEIPGEISKTGERRLIPMQPALDAWLSPFYGRSGLVVPIANIQLKVRTFLEQCEFPNIPPNWSRNWLRQSYCSYRLAQTGKVLDTAAEDGHDAYVLERVYAHRSTEEDAKAFFALTPAACGKADWHERVKAFLIDVPEVPQRRKKKTRGWKGLDGKAQRTLPPGAPGFVQPD